LPFALAISGKYFEIGLVAGRGDGVFDLSFNKHFLAIIA
jgi:hypothetical protein